MKLKAPDGFISGSYNGKPIIVGDDGTVDVSPECASILIGSHKFSVYAAGEDSDGVQDLSSGGGIESMSRTELFAYLRMKGVKARFTASNDELRELAMSAPCDPQEILD